MEKFFLVKNECALYRDYYAWQRNEKERIEWTNRFFSEHGIEARMFDCSYDRLWIIPTENDIKTFGKQFTGTVSKDGIRVFRKNSNIGKAWKEYTKGRKIIYKPFPTMYLKNIGCGRYKTRLFDHNGTVYCSIEGDMVDVNSDALIEIKGSEFYKVMEDLHDDEVC